MTTNATDPISQGETPAILEEMGNLKAQIEEQAKIIQQQQTLLTSPEFLNRTAPAPAEESPKAELKTMQDLVDYVGQMVDQKISANNDTFSREVVPLIKRATPESPVWAKTDMANKIAAERPGMTMEDALELAEYRMQKEAEKQAQLKEEAEKLEAQRRINNASLGSKHNSTTPEPHREVHSLDEAMEKNWQALDMEAKLMEHNNNVEDVWAGDSKSIKVQYD